MPQPRAGDEGKVVAFKPGAMRLRPEDRAETRERGTILLFTGIRYQRFPDDASFLAATGRHHGAAGEDRARS